MRKFISSNYGNNAASGVSRWIVWGVRAEMIPLELWRARIGLFNCTVSCYSLPALNRSPSVVAVAPHRRGTGRKTTRVPSDQSQDSEPSESTSLPTCPVAATSSLSSASSCIYDPTCLFLLLNSSLLITAIICQLLMTSGDIETNPGPRGGENSVTIKLCDYS